MISAVLIRRIIYTKMVYYEFLMWLPMNSKLLDQFHCLYLLLGKTKHRVACSFRYNITARLVHSSPSFWQ